MALIGLLLTLKELVILGELSEEFERAQFGKAAMNTEDAWYLLSITVFGFVTWLVTLAL